MANNIIGLNPSVNNPAASLVTGVVSVVGGANPSTPLVFDLLSAYTSASMTTVVAGGPASTTIQLQGSMDGTNWTTVATSTSTTGDTQFSAAGSVFNSLRVNVSAVAGGAAPTVALSLAAYGAADAGQAAATQPVSGTVTSNQGTKGAAANGWPVVITNSGGTNIASVNSNGGVGVCGTSTTPFVGGILFVQGSDGTNLTPVGDAVGRAVFQKLTDGVSTTGVDVPTGGGVTGNALLVSTGNVVAGTSLTTATTGNGTTIDFGSSVQNVTAFILVNGTVTSGTVRVQVSHDGTNWASFPTDLISGTLGTGVNAVLNSISGAWRFARAQVGTNIGGGGSVTVTLSGAG